MSHPFQRPKGRLLAASNIGIQGVTRLDPRCALVEVREADLEFGDEVVDSISVSQRERQAGHASPKTIKRHEGSHMFDVERDSVQKPTAILVMGCIADTKGGCGCKRYEAIPVDPFCVDTFPHFTGAYKLPDCSA